MPALLSIDDLRIKYGAREVLKGISLHVDEGEIVTVLGANGAGKSTLLQAVCGLIPVAGGTITYAGRTLNRVPAY
ncbi:MAG TPA: ATP-binding cassette domain-containing protein, partial [Deltaproteobacteria bacterium]|nr:ATP-binding cassette domain-containing protein [Deltaproteobacteria bacterium]